MFVFVSPTAESGRVCVRRPDAWNPQWGGSQSQCSSWPRRILAGKLKY